MDVVINKVVTILQVLTLADTVGSYQHVDILLQMGIDGSTLFGYGRKERQHLIEVEFLA